MVSDFLGGGVGRGGDKGCGYQLPGCGNSHYCCDFFSCSTCDASFVIVDSIY